MCDCSEAAQPDSPGAAAATTHVYAGILNGSAIEAAGSQEGDPDEFERVDGYETGYESGSGESLGSTSATSSIYAHTFEHGRRYHHFKNGRYPLPDDDEEQKREDMKHAMMLELTDGKLFHAPVGDNPQQILDIGTGTGIWAIDVGDRYPGAHVRGIDQTPIQPIWVPPNVDFLVDDCNNDWLARNIDLAHFRFMTIVLQDVPNVLGNCFESLKPGGWVELQELQGEILCDDETMLDDDPLKYVYELGAKAFKLFGMDVLIPQQLEAILRAAGFVNIQCIPKKVPIGVWAQDKTLRLVGLYQKTAISEFLSAMAGRPFEALGIDATARQAIVALARRSLEDTTIHRYMPYYFWYAQKPENFSNSTRGSAPGNTGASLAVSPLADA
ncbi:hypothetical protein CMQ_2873 [Grosmannia clavigera kw1407]|uniref:Methyltransferase type 11 n=1 Tax=Grosmannia clavigera (strain kw1407 / UAMH 11150) TaxID=655863 RepID=F0XGJ8_GROCL|nr:uncharacterized protein CMQ_2873 [Grosmannia clavigera kw1407]EFX02944.1 hypothetical protein CMQ_2873 [Grosmannia clavigera kw1407]